MGMVERDAGRQSNHAVADLYRWQLDNPKRPMPID
jgi:hypothetical protein